MGAAGADPDLVIHVEVVVDHQVSRADRAVVCMIVGRLPKQNSTIHTDAKRLDGRVIGAVLLQSAPALVNVGLKCERGSWR